MGESRYSEHLDTLTALITYLALTPKKSRTAPNLSLDLSLDPEVVQATFDAFPGVFRKSKNPDASGNPFYTIHARYALRAYDGEGSGDELPEVRPDVLAVLLEFVTHAARAEQERTQFEAQLQSTRDAAQGAQRSARLAALVAAIAAVLALIGSLVGAAIGA